jgi:hypothetical protein
VIDGPDDNLAALIIGCVSRTHWDTAGHQEVLGSSSLAVQSHNTQATKSLKSGGVSMDTCWKDKL